ncbi:DNA-3-methyladenine glycosylase I [Rhodococcus sp. As11]|uniref:DNA-3-methyladenine glycosylase I n=1 Tax=Rhodococcus sp. As11 TaxID=3029189 RepID=UPI003BA1FCA9
MRPDEQGAVIDTDDRVRCPWAVDGPGSSLYRDYHDCEWGRPLHGRDEMFERLSLEAFQSGLSWLTILRKREAFRAAFRGFDVDAVACFTEADVERLLADAGIVRNRRKIEAVIANARAVLELPTALDDLLWSFAPPRRARRLRTIESVPAVTPESTAMARELKRRGFRFVGPTTAYALMQATGMVDDHLESCWVSLGPQNPEGSLTQESATRTYSR